MELPGAVGKRRRVRRGGYLTQQDAEEAARRLSTATKVGGSYAAMSTGEFLTGWVASKRLLAPSTLSGYRIHLDLYLLPHLGRITLAELRSTDIQRMFDTIIAEHAAAGRPISPATLARIRATLRAALSAAVRHELIPANPASRIELPPVPSSHAVVWTPERIAAWQSGAPRPAVAIWTPELTVRFLNAIGDHPLYAIFHVMALRGRRRGEACGLRWSDVDLNGKTLTIARQLQEDHGTLRYGPPKSRASQRTIAIDTGTTAALARHRAAQVTAGTYRPDGPVAATRDGTPIRPDNLSHLFVRMVAAAGLPPIRLHDLRHGAASLAMAAGVSLRTIQAQLGHASFALTADTYISILPQAAHAAAQDTADLLAAVRHPRGYARRGGIGSRIPVVRVSRAVKRSASMTATMNGSIRLRPGAKAGITFGSPTGRS